MSRIGKKPVILPTGVTVTIADNDVSVKGSKGELKMVLNERSKVEQKTDDAGVNYLSVTVIDKKDDAAIWGTMRSLLEGMVKGVSEGWSKQLELNGVGFKMNVAGRTLKMSLGFSHPVDYEIADGIDATIEGNVLTIAGMDKMMVGKVAAEIRALKKPEPYKGKGFKYVGEVIRRKVGKAAKTE